MVTSSSSPATISVSWEEGEVSLSTTKTVLSAPVTLLRAAMPPGSSSLGVPARYRLTRSDGSGSMAAMSRVSILLTTLLPVKARWVLGWSGGSRSKAKGMGSMPLMTTPAPWILVMISGGEREIMSFSPGGSIQVSAPSASMTTEGRRAPR